MEDYSVERLRVVIPVGGEATRLKPLTAEVSKACVRLLNRPIIEIALASLAKQGVKNFIFGVRGYVNYKSLYDYFKEGAGFSARYEISPRVHIKYQPNEEDFGSADSLRINLDYYGIVVRLQLDNSINLPLARTLD